MQINRQQKYILKLKSKRLRNSNWNLKISLSESFENEELISISESEAIRFIYEIKNTNIEKLDNSIKEKRKKIKSLKKEHFSIENRKKIKSLYESVHKDSFLEDYITVSFDTIKDYNYACKEGFSVNDIKFKKIVGTTGGIKSKTIVFVSTLVYDKLLKKIINGANEIPIVPAKLEAYRALTFSSSTRVSQPKGIVIVNDWETKFKSDITEIGDDEEIGLYVKDIKDADMTLEDSDGYGAICPELSKEWAEILGLSYLPSGYIIRNSYCKGSLFTFDFHEFASRVANKGVITDIWGDTHNVAEVQLIMPASMLKLWSAYRGIDDWVNNCKINGYSFSVTKVIPKELDNFRDMNYQFLQSLDLNDEELRELLKPTIDEIHDVLGGDYRKTLLFLRGDSMNENNAWMESKYDYVQAMMVNKDMINDPFVKSQIFRMIKKRINEAKTGVIRVKGNFTIISGDIYGFMEYAFDLDSPKGLLKANQFYSNYWNKKGVSRVTAFRAPMTCHQNIKIMNIVSTKDMEYWYRYMPNVTIFNAWDCACHTLNGADKDGDTVFTTDNEIIMRGVNEGNPLICIQSSANKIIPTEKDILDSIKNGFGEKIGAYTNRATTMEQIKVKFKKDSKEFIELDRRIKLCMHFQQAEIDKIKGIKSPPMPKEWYSYSENKIHEDDSEDVKKQKEFNLSIMVNKKPKFMIYIYQDLMKQYKDFVSASNSNCLMRFKCTVDELKMKICKSRDELEFLRVMEIQNPVEDCDSLMNKVCKIFEDEFDEVTKSFKGVEFDYSFLVPDVKVSHSRRKSIKNLYKDYQAKVKAHMTDSNINNEDDDDSRLVMVENFREKAFTICPDEKELAKILLTEIYDSNNSKQFVWIISGEYIIRELLKNNNNIFYFPEKAIDSNDYDFVYSYEKYKMKQVCRLED